MTALVALPIAAVQSGAPLAPVFSAYQVESLPFHTKSNRWILNEFTLLGRVCCDSNSSVRFVNMTKASFNVILTSICVNCRFLIVVLYMQCILAILLVVGVKLVPHFSPHHKYGKTTEQKQNRNRKKTTNVCLFTFFRLFFFLLNKKRFVWQNALDDDLAVLRVCLHRFGALRTNSLTLALHHW